MFSRLRSWFSKFQLPGITFGGPGPEQWPFAQAWVRGNFPRVGPVRQPYKEHVWTAVAIESIAQDAATVEWELFRVDRRSGGVTDQVLQSHPVLDLWRRPNAVMVGSDLFEASYIHYLLEGECWWIAPRGGFQVSREGSLLRNGAEGIELAPSWAVETRPNDAGTDIQYILYPHTDRERVLPRNEFVQFRRYNPYNPTRGLPKFNGIATDVRGDVAAAHYNANVFGENAGMPSGVLKPGDNIPQDWTPEQRAELKKLMQRHGGVRRGWAVLPKWTELIKGPNQSEMDYAKLRELASKLTLAGYSLPPFLAGAGDSTKFANAKAQINTYWNGTITRVLTYFQNVINYDFLPKAGVTDVQAVPRWETIRALTENLLDKSTVAERWRKVGVPLTEINDRLELGLDLKGVKGANEPLISSSLKRIDEEPEEEQPEQPEQDEEAEAELRAV